MNMVTDSGDNKHDVSADDTILDIWGLVNKILQQQTLLESWMKGGLMNIAKARYVMGQHSVSANQLPSGECEVSARLLVARDPASPEDTDPVVFRLREQLAADGDTKSGDPLRWFSALPPGALRDAQQQFRRALEITCDIASMKSELQLMMARLEGSRKKGGEKREKVEEASELAEAVDALSFRPVPTESTAPAIRFMGSRRTAPATPKSRPKLAPKSDAIAGTANG